MKTIFLASGRSARMEPLSDKNLLEFCGEPLVLKLLKNAQAGGLENFVVVTNGENTDAIRGILEDHNFPAEIAVQKDLDEGMAGGVTAGLELVNDNEAVFVLGGNDYIEASAYAEVLKKSEGLDGGILAKKVEKYFPGGYLQVSGENKITSIVEKPGEGKEPSDMINIVAHFFSSAGDLKQALEIAKSKKDDVYEVALQSLFEEKYFVAVEYSGMWQAVKYPWHVLELGEIFLAQQETNISPVAEIADSAIIKGDGVFIEDGVRIFENAVIQGPCYIGKNAIVGNNALVRNSILGEKCVAGYNTEIARSFLSPNVTTHIAYVGDSIVDRDVNFGAFSCTANLRLDHKTVRVKIKEERVDSLHEKLGAIVGAGAQIGTHAMLMPGVCIGRAKLCPPGEVQK
jgi:UDP-N-acetylglucosamine diphosphorylase / glucose-1-phosphate thymidylyltransferase / UDP-N-acetylgalactosamine diphosphorylase / glucosamine-1-phosphate N-acetyltransferase / galactosamine-1-phosphate N-acetyltransferase